MKRLLIIAAYVFAGFIVLLLSVGLYFKTRITPMIKDQLNQQLAVQVDVSHIGVSSIRNFPNLGLHFDDVLIEESQKHYDKPLLKAADLDLYIDVMRLFRGDYVIDEVRIKEGELHLADFSEGSNYEIFKTDSSEDAESLSFAIEDLRLSNMQVDYQHLGSEFIAAGDLKTIKAKLKYSEEATVLKIKGDLFTTLIEQSGETYLKDKDATLSTEITLEDDNNKISIAPSDLHIAAVDLTTGGLILLDDETTDIDISFENEDAPLKNILSITPAYVQESFSHLDLDGRAQIKGFFKGKISEKENPSFGFTYDIGNTTVYIREQALKLRNINASGELQIPNMGSMRSAWVSCKLKNASSGTTNINGAIRVDNFDLPRISWDGIAKMDAPTAFALLDTKDLNIQKGNVLIDGKLKLTYDPNIGAALPNSLKYVGKVQANSVSGTLNDPDLVIHNFNFDISADNRQMVIKSCKLDYNETHADLKGYVVNSDDLLSADSKTEIVGELNIAGLNMNEFETEDSDTASEISKNLFPYTLQLRTNLTDFTYQGFTADEITGTLKSNKSSIYMDQGKISALTGDAVASVRFTTLGNNYLLDVNSNLNSIDIKELFRQFNNFEQEEITHEHISGDLNGKILAKVLFDKNYEPLLDKLYAKADVEILNGQLVGYEPLKELSDFVEVDDLEDVKFSSLKNTIEIFDRTIYIPKMFIGNNALSMEIEGTHNFDNYMEYRMSISLVELLANRSNWIAKKKEKRIEENSNGGLTAYLTMTGTPDDLTISYDKAKAREVFAEEVKKEKKNFLNALRGEATRDDEKDLTNYNDIWDE